MPGDLQISAKDQFHLNEDEKIVIGVIRESKTPPDSRVPLTPIQCRKLMAAFPSVKIVVESSANRCYKDEEYRAQGIKVQSSPLTGCNILMGVKEVKPNCLIPDKTYFFFSHTIKKQPYNRDLLRTILKKQIRLIDYECLIGGPTDKRVIAFGRWAGIVGAHNTIFTYGKKSGRFELPRLCNCRHFSEVKDTYKKLNLEGVKVVLTGTGRVANGSAEVLNQMGFKKVSPVEFTASENHQGPIYVQLRTRDIFGKKTDDSFDMSFYENPEVYHSLMKPYLSKANVLINGIYWDSRAPKLFTLEEMKSDDFRIRVIGDITCDIAPEASIPCTLRPATIKNPVFGFDPLTGEETQPFLSNTVDMMTVDNLPNELPCDASSDFGEQFIKHVFPNLLEMNFEPQSMLDRACIAVDGRLNTHYQYLTDYVSEQILSCNNNMD